MNFRRRLTYGDFKRYFHNNMQARDKHDFEKRVMQDAFEEEAYEGLSRLSGGEMEEDLEELKGHINKRVVRRRRIVPYWLRYAASVLLLVGIGIGFYIMDHPFERKEVIRQPVVEDQRSPGGKETTGGLSQTKPSERSKTGKLDKSGVGAGEEEQPEIADNAITSSAVKSAAEEQSQPLDAEAPEAKSTGQEQPERVHEADQATGIGVDEFSGVKQNERQAMVKSAPKDSGRQNESVQSARTALKNRHVAAFMENDSSSKSRKLVRKKAGVNGPQPPNNQNLEKYREEVLEKIDYAVLSEYPGKHSVKFKFTVKEDGSLADFHFRRYPDSVFVREIQHAMEMMGAWKPASRGGKKVSSGVMMNLEVEVRER